METALLLGLASGGACLGTCGPLVASFLAAERVTLRRSTALLTAFLAGRLLGYIGWAMLSWPVGRMIFADQGGFKVSAAVALVLGGWLMYYGISHPSPQHRICPVSILNPSATPTVTGRIFLRSTTWGILSGIQICPPFLAAVNEAARTGSLEGSLLFFFIFYLGTGIWFIPFPLIGKLGRFPQVAQVARFCALLLGAYYVLSGFTSMGGGNGFDR